MDSKLNESTETDFNSTLPDNGKLFSSHTVRTLSLIDLEKNYNAKNNNEVINDTTNNTNIYENHRTRQPVNSAELTLNSDPLNTNSYYHTI